MKSAPVVQTEAASTTDSTTNGTRCEPPDALKQRRRWITRRGKVPIENITKPSEWFSYSAATEQVHRSNASGIGFVLGHGIVGIDIDKCIADDGTLHPMAQDAIATLNTYGEYSPSGKGLHFYICGTVLDNHNLKATPDKPKREIYDGRKDSARFFTYTGNHIPGTATQLASGPEAQAKLDAFYERWYTQELGGNPPILGEPNTGSILPNLPSRPDADVLRSLFNEKDGARWHSLYDGDFSGYGSQSEADLALCRKLRFYSRADAKLMDRLFRLSGLMRPKWDTRHGTDTYGAITIAKALSTGGPVYNPKDDTELLARCAEKEREKFAIIPAWVFVRLQGNGELAFRVYGFLAVYAGTKSRQAWPSVKTIAAHCRVTERRVKAAVKLLKAAGVITPAGRHPEKNTIIYTLRALGVSETITPYVKPKKPRPKALGVPQDGHLGCSRVEPIRDHERTIVDTEGRAA